jgi:hypothetical protein
MKRLFLLVVTALSAAALAGGVQAASDTRGPACTNVVGGGDSLAYVSPGDGTGVVEATFELDAPACPDASYSLAIYTFNGTTRLVKNVQPTSISGNIVFFHYEFASGAPTDGVCLVGETEWKGHESDRVPDSGCAPVENTFNGGSAGGYGGWN